MASQKFHIIDTENEMVDGVITSPDKKKLGVTWINDGPYGNFITGQLDGYWIITDEDYKLLKKIKNGK